LRGIDLAIYASFHHDIHLTISKILQQLLLTIDQFLINIINIILFTLRVAFLQ
jgi:hypothetical protein